MPDFSEHTLKKTDRHPRFIRESRIKRAHTLHLLVCMFPCHFAGKAWGSAP